MEKTTYKSSNPDKGALKKAIDAELKNASVEDQMLDRMYKFKVIELPLNYPYYNLENVRTTTACEEYAKKNNLPSDYFSRKNFWLTAAQDHYHEVIMGQLYETKASERYHTILGQLEKDYEEKKMVISKKKKEEIKRIVKEYNEKPDDLAKILAEKYGLDYVE